MDAYLLVKWLHVLSSTVLFGTGLGTAWYFWSAHRTGDPVIIASVGRMVVRADWLFTGSSGIAQPLTGLYLVHRLGYPLSASWLIASYCLYAVAFACWAPVVALQIQAQRMAQQAADANQPLGANYRRVMRLWFILGWPAFLGLIAVFWLMITKPDLW
jgi:uncharacterized membrane protein